MTDETERRVRLIRVLEYDYPSQEAYEADVLNWATAPNGILRIPKSRTDGDLVIRSATTLSETMPAQDEGTSDV